MDVNGMIGCTSGQALVAGEHSVELDCYGDVTELQLPSLKMQGYLGLRPTRS